MSADAPFQRYAQALIDARARRGSDAALVLLPDTDSTQTIARGIVDAYRSEHPTAPDCDVVAWAQRAGRGRADRAWFSPAGAGVYATLVRQLDATRVPQLPMIVSVALVDALRARLGPEVICGLKWPNDLMARRAADDDPTTTDGPRKLGGILIDVRAAATDGDAAGVTALIGFGVNHGGRAADFADAGAPHAVSLAQLTTADGDSPAATLADTADALLAAVSDALARPPSAEALVDRYRAASIHRAGDALRCSLPDGNVRLGTFDGFDDRGFLRLRLPDGAMHLIAAGEVMLAAAQTSTR
ncbi:MAG: biotin--[acetyl-CoA-carboxylase] ligase [Acidobacteriota bacterium]